MATKWSSEILGKSAVDFGALLKDEYAVVLLQGKNVFGDMIYCYVKLTLPHIEKLQHALTAGGTFNPSDFGEVVAAGKGLPPEEVRAEIALTYPMIDKPRPMQTAKIDPAEKKDWDEY